MDNEEIQGKKFSEFPSVTPGGADEVVGLHAGDNARFTVANFILAIRQGLVNLFVPLTRTVNSKALSTDITLNASDVGAVPTTREVNGHALSSDIALDASDVGAVDADDVGVAGGVASLGNDGKVPSAQLPAIASTAADVTYDNTQSGLTAEDVQEAIDELAAGAGGGGVDPETIAPVEESTTATVAHPLGSIFYLNDVLYRALSDIAVGGTINTGAGGNSTQTTVAQNFKRTVTLTSAQYAQLSAAEKAADIVYIVTDEVVDYATQGELAYVETSTTASRAYAVGEYFCLAGLLYRAIQPISNGGTFTPGTNCESTTVATEILSKGNTKYTQYYLTSAQTITHRFSKSCMFILMTERISTNALPQSDELSFGYISTTNKNTNRYHDLHAPTSDPVTISLELGYMTITTPLSNIRVTIIEFTDT